MCSFSFLIYTNQIVVQVICICFQLAVVDFVARHFVAFTSSQSFRCTITSSQNILSHCVRRTLIFFVLLLTIFSVSLLITLFFIPRNVIERLIHFYLVNHALHKNEQFYKKKQEKKRKKT